MLVANDFFKTSHNSFLVEFLNALCYDWVLVSREPV